MSEPTVYGCTSADFTSRNGRPVPNSPYSIWTEEEGGAQRTDLLAMDGTPIPEPISDDDGGVRFKDPLGGEVPMWADTGWGRRVAVRPLMTVRGKSAYEVAVAAGFEGTEEAWLASLAGPITGTGSAEQILFTQTGTGAVERDLDGILRERISVKDFGAVGDGTTDDTAAIQAAVSAAEATVTNSGLTGGGRGATVFFPRGTYKLTAALNPITKDNIYLAGESPASAQLTLPSGVTAFTWHAASAMHGGGLTNLRLAYTAGASSSTVLAKIGNSASWSMTGCSVINPVKMLVLGDASNYAYGPSVRGTRIVARADATVPVIDAVKCMGLSITDTSATCYPVSGPAYPTGTDPHFAAGTGRDFLKITSLDTLEVAQTMVYGFDVGLRTTPAVGTAVQNMTLASSWFDMCARALACEGAGSTVDLQAISCYFCGTDGPGIDLDGGYVGGVTLIAPTIMYCGTDGIRMDGAVDHVVVVGGKISLLNRLGAGGYVVNISDSGAKSDLRFAAVGLGGDGPGFGAACIATDTHPNTLAAQLATFTNCTTAGRSTVTLTAIHEDGIAAAAIRQGAITAAHLGRGNLLTANQQSVGTDTSGFSAVNACTIAHSTDWAGHGSASLKVTATGASATAGTSTGTAGARVEAGKVWTFTAKLHAGSGSSGKSVRLYWRWFNASGAEIGWPWAAQYVAGTFGDDLTLSKTVLAPAGAAHAAICVQSIFSSSGDEFYVDCFGIWEGSETSWGKMSMPPAVTGSRGGNAALTSLLSALASLGLVTDSTS